MEMDYAGFIFSNPLLTWTYFIAAFAILGGGIKYIDDAFDEHTFKKNKALLFAPFLAIFWAFNMVLSPAAGTILAAVVLAVLLKGKIDNIAFQVGLIGIIGVLIFFGLFSPIWIVLLVLTLAGILDEVGNDYVDRHSIKNNIVYYFFEYRMLMKLSVFAFAFFAFYGWVYFFAFLAFDLAYAGIMHYSSNLKHGRKFYYFNNSNNTMRKKGALNEA